MEWVETTARTVEEAQDILLDRLGVDEDEAEIEVLEEPKAGLFGRVRGQARVRARVKPKSPRAKEDGRKRSRRSSSDKSKGGGSTAAAPAAGAAAPAASGGESAPSKPQADRGPRPERSREGRDGDGRRGDGRRGGDSRRDDDAPPVDAAPLVPVATEFVEGVVAAFGLDATTTGSVNEDGEIEIAVDGTGLGSLIGPAGGVLEALQEVTRTVVQKNADGPAPRLRLDVGGFRANRRDALSAFVAEVAAKVKDTGVTHVFEVMGSSDRKVVHDAVNDIDGVATSSIGEDPDRRVVVKLDA